MSRGIENRQAVPQGADNAAEVTQRLRRRARQHPLEKVADNGRLQKLPAAGDKLFGFRLRQELGRGAFACVFLAEQADLAGRPVVLKVSGTDGDEPQTLAQLQHTHIVPIYSAHEDARAGLRAVCMPYFGGASLAQVLEALWAQPSPPTRGEELVRALRAASPPAEEAGPPGPEAAARDGSAGPASLGLLAGLSYVRAAAWVVARLAEALQHAHQRGVFHRDIKPSNVLLTADGQPMLLDFNVAQNLRVGRTKALLGGTVAYMAPEHLQALSSGDAGPACEVDHRSDIYSLGLVLFELLTGGKPFGQGGSYSPLLPVLVAMAMERGGSLPSLRQKRGDVPWGLESITRKCLAPDPAQRYQQAEHLAEDLRRFLEDRPLRYAPELSWGERARKWLRRHPRLASSGSVATAAAVLLAGAGAALVGVRGHLAATRAELAGAQAQERRRAYEAGTVRALCLVNTTTEVQDHLRQGIVGCEEALALYGVLDRDDWQQHPDWQRLDPDVRQRLGEDTRELLLLLAWARVRTAPGDPAALRGALALLDRAEAVAGLAPSRALWEDRAQYHRQLGDLTKAEACREEAERIQPSGARDHYLLATAYAHNGRYARAVEELSEALRLNPRHYWSLTQRGICYQELGQYALAAGDFGACVGLWPEFAWGYFNRGYVLQKGGQKEEAVRDYTAALERDPGFLLAHLNRGMVRLELKQYEPALADLRRAAELGRDDAGLHLGLGMALEGLGRLPEADDAFEAARRRAAAAPPEVCARVHWVYGFTVSARAPDQAWEAFAEVLRHDPKHPQALYGRAMLLVGRQQEPEAIAALGQALAADPRFVDARRGRAVLLARAGDFDQAGDDIHWCLAREPDGGATAYAAACVSSLALARAADSALAEKIAAQTLALLERAFALGYGRDKAAEDPDLKEVRRRPEFDRLLKGPIGNERK